jgi:hypothetical protein
MSRLPQGCEDWGARLVQHASAQFAVASKENRQNQNHWQKALKLLQEVTRPIWLSKKNTGDPMGLPPDLNQKVRDNLIQVMRRQAPCLSLGDSVNTLEPVPLHETAFYRNRNYKDSAYFLMASMYELTRIQDTKLTKQVILRPEAKQHLRDDIPLDFDHRTGKQGAWKAMTGLVNEGFVSQDRGFGVNHMHWLTKLGYRMCYLLFHVKDFGVGPRPRPIGCYVTKDGDVLPGSPPVNFENHQYSPAAAVSSMALRACTPCASPLHSVSTSWSSGLPNIPLANAPKSNLFLYELHQHKRAHVAPASALAPSFSADTVDMSDDDADLQLAIRLSQESLLNDSLRLPNLHPENVFLQKQLSNRVMANKVTVLLPGVHLENVEQVPLKQNLFNFSSSVKGLTGNYKIQGQWDSESCKPSKMSCTCPDDKKCCKHIVATLYSYAKHNQAGITQPLPSPLPQQALTRPPQNDVIVLDSDDEDVKHLPLQASTYMESDSLEYLGTAPSGWDEGTDYAFDLLQHDPAMRPPDQPAVGFMSKNRVPHNAAISMLMCETERHQQANYRKFYHETAEVFANFGKRCSVHVTGKLPLGDFQFQFQCSGDSPDDPSLVSDVIIERKTISDIVTSSAGDRELNGTARHVRQESRLRHCKLQRACMLFEGDPDCICRILQGPRTQHDLQLLNPDCLNTKDDVMKYQASIIARNYARNQVFVLQSASVLCSQLFLAAISQMLLVVCSEQSSEAMSSADFAKFCGAQCRATSKLCDKLLRAGAHCELVSRISRRYPDEESVLGLYETCSRPLERLQVLQHLQVSGSNANCTVLNTMPACPYTEREAINSSQVIYKNLFGSTNLPPPAHPQFCSEPEVHVFGSADSIMDCVEASLPVDSPIRVHLESECCVLNFFSQNCCSRSQQIHVTVVRGVDVLHSFLLSMQQQQQQHDHNHADETRLCMETAMRVAREVVTPLVTASRMEKQAVTSLLVLEDVFNGNGGACVRFKKRVAQSQATFASTVELENGATFSSETASLVERNGTKLFMLMEAHLLVKYGVQVRHSKNATETKKFVWYLFFEQRAQAPLLYRAIPVVAPVSAACYGAAANVASPRPINAASDRELIVLDDSPPEINPFPARAQLPKARAAAAGMGDKAPQPKKKRKSKEAERNADRDPFTLDDSPEESPKRKRRATSARTSVTSLDHRTTQSIVEEDAMRELMRVLELAKVVPDVSRQLFASSMIKCGVSSLQALREGLAAKPVVLDLQKDVGMNVMQQGCLMRWLENSP